MFILKVIKSHFKGSYEKQFLHSLTKFRMKWWLFLFMDTSLSSFLLLFSFFYNLPDAKWYPKLHFSHRFSIIFRKQSQIKRYCWEKRIVLARRRAQVNRICYCSNGCHWECSYNVSPKLVKCFLWLKNNFCLIILFQSLCNTGSWPTFVLDFYGMYQKERTINSQCLNHMHSLWQIALTVAYIGARYVRYWNT